MKSAKRWAAALTAALVVIAFMGFGHVQLSDADPTRSSDLKDHVVSVEVEGGTLDGDVITVKPGTELVMRMSFKESRDVQFDEDSLSYALPSGFDYGSQQGTFPLQITDEGKTVSMNVPYTIENGVLTITWPHDDESWELLREASNAQFNIAFRATVENADGKIQFGNGVTKTFKLDTTHDVDIRKDGYVGNDGKAHYTLTVTSHGRNADVAVSDTVTGTALAYDQGSFAISGNSSTPTVTERGDGFDVTLPSMSDGEVATISYTAAIDYSKITGEGTADQTGNVATAKTPDTPEKRDSKDFANQIHASGISKTGALSGDAVTRDGRTFRSVEWHIDANPDHHVTLAGKAITDQIDEASRNVMRYSGTGIRIEVYGADGNLVETRDATWADLGVTDLSTASSWRYEVPAADGAYEYRISYTTDVDITGSIANVPARNAASVTPDGPSTSGGVDVPASFDFRVAKQATSVSASEATWQFTMTVPKEGYDTLEATDTLPWVYLDGRNVSDGLVEGSVHVDGLAGTETYDMETANDGNGSRVHFVFYRDAGKTQTGLTGTGSERTITVTLTTRHNPDWLATVDAGTTADWQKTHTNNVNVTANGTSKHASASVVPTLNRTIAKSGSLSGTTTIGGTSYPVYRYEVQLTGVADDTIDLTDTFDTRVLTYYDPAAYGDYSRWDGNDVFGGNQYSQDQRIAGKGALITPTALGVRIHVPADALPKTDSGNYSHYRIVYYLVVKDAAALAELNQRAAANSGTTDLANTVSWGGTSSTCHVSHTYDLLDKTMTKMPHPAKNDRTASYSIKLNPDGIDINPSGDTLVLTDVMTNQVLDVSSIKVDPSDGVSYDYDPDSATLTVTFPDATPVALTYDTTVTGTGDVEYSNTASLWGQTKRTDQKQSFSHGGSGTASIPRIKLLKHVKGDLTQTLEGATFSLYRAGDDGSINWDDPVTGKDNAKVSFTSDANGIVLVRGGMSTDGWVLEEGDTYYLVETAAPQGYKLDPTPIKFTITDNPTAPDQYPNGFTIEVSNESAAPGGTTLPVTGGMGWRTPQALGTLLVAMSAAALAIRKLRKRGEA